MAIGKKEIIEAILERPTRERVSDLERKMQAFEQARYDISINCFKREVQSLRAELRELVEDRCRTVSNEMLMRQLKTEEFVSDFNRRFSDLEILVETLASKIKAMKRRIKKRAR